MTDFEKISAAVDGEVSDSELKDLIQSFQAEDFDKVDSYYLIGDLIRSSDLASHHRPLRTANIRVAIENEPVVLAPNAAQIGATKNTEAQPKLGLNIGKRFYKSFAVAAGVAMMAFGLQQLVPPVDSNVRMVRSESANKLSPAEVAAWQEYFLAHQQNVVRGGLSAVSPVVRADAETPNIRWVEQVNLNTNKGYDWMNVWDKPSNQPNSGKIQYVSSDR